MLERAKLALSASSDKDFAHKLGINASTVVGYKQRGVVPLEQCIKIAEQTGVSLDWLILGKGKAPNNPVTTWHTVIERHTINGQTVETRRRRRTAVNANENKAPKIPGIENKTFETNFGINIDDEKIRLVPLYDVPVSAGYGSFFDEENSNKLVIKKEGLIIKGEIYPWERLKPIKLAKSFGGLVEIKTLQDETVFSSRTTAITRVPLFEALYNSMIKERKSNIF